MLIVIKLMVNIVASAKAALVMLILIVKTIKVKKCYFILYN